jgi:hypothetical protein
VLGHVAEVAPLLVMEVILIAMRITFGALGPLVLAQKSVTTDFVSGPGALGPAALCRAEQLADADLDAPIRRGDPGRALSLRDNGQVATAKAFVANGL